MPTSIACYTITHNPNLEWLEEAKASIKACDFDEYVLLDDGSDEPVKGAKARFKINQGVVKARNSAIELTHSVWVAMLDDDDLFIPEHVKRLKTFLPNIEADIISFPVGLFGEETGYWASEPNMANILENNQIPAGSWIRREVWEALKYKNYPAEDWDFWARAVKKGFRFAHCSLPIYKHRIRKGSLSRDWTGQKFLDIKKQIYANYNAQA